MTMTLTQAVLAKLKNATRRGDWWAVPHEFEVIRGRSLELMPTIYKRERFPGNTDGLLDAYRAFRAMIKEHPDAEIALNVCYGPTEDELCWLKSFDWHGIKPKGY